MTNQDWTIYPPPSDGWPYLAVTIAPDQSVTARRFLTRKEAQDFIDKFATHTDVEGAVQSTIAGVDKPKG